MRANSRKKAQINRDILLAATPVKRKEDCLYDTDDDYYTVLK